MLYYYLGMARQTDQETITTKNTVCTHSSQEEGAHHAIVGVGVGWGIGEAQGQSGGRG